jgi:hypothetical protein
VEDSSASDDEFYTKSILGNPVSFEEAAGLVGAMASDGTYTWVGME